MKNYYLKASVLLLIYSLMTITTIKATVISEISGGDGLNLDNPAYYIDGDSASLLNSISDGTEGAPHAYGPTNPNYNGNGDFYLTGVKFTNNASFGIAESENLQEISLYIINGTTLGNNASLYLYGIYGKDNTINNYANINLSSTGGVGVNASSYAYGVYADMGISNGDISVSAKGGTAVDDGTFGSATASAQGYGIKGDVGQNNGNIDVTSTGGTATIFGTETIGFTHAIAYGIDGNVEQNNGNISVHATTGTVVSLPEQSEDARAFGGDFSADACGITGFVGENYGNIIATATSNAGDANAFGTGSLRGVRGDDGFTYLNHGDMTVTARSKTGNAMAIGMFGLIFNRVVNEVHGVNYGDIKVSATSDTADAFALGIYSYLEQNHGDVNVSATSSSGNANAYGIVVMQPNLFVNTGEINVTTASETGQNDLAFGIYFGESGLLYSSNLINVQSESGIANPTRESPMTRDFQVYCAGNLAISAYAMKFNNQEQVNDDYTGVIFVQEDVNSVFTNDAKLYAFTDNNFNGKDTFEIPTLVMNADTSNQFNSVDLASASPDYEVELINGEHGANQQISLTYAPKASTPLLAIEVGHKSTRVAMGIVKNNNAKPMLTLMRRGDPRLASTYDGLKMASNNPIQNPNDLNHMLTPDMLNDTFAMPYYTNIMSNTSPVRYEANTTGLVGGYNHWLNSDSRVGFHLAYGTSKIDYEGSNPANSGYDQKEEEMETYTIGLQGIHRFAEYWLIEFMTSLSYSENEYEDHNPLNPESGDYERFGLDTRLTLSHVFNVNDNNSFIPSLGLHHLWAYQDSYTVDSTLGADITYGSMDEHQLYGFLGVDYYGVFEVTNDWIVSPNVGIGIEQAFTDNEFSNTMSVGTVTQNMVNTVDSTFVTTNAGVEFTRKTVSVELGYRGHYANDTKVNTFYLQLRYRF